MTWLPDIWTWLTTNFTDDKGKLNWDAFSAIGTVGALWFVVVQTTRQGRAERAKALGTLTYLHTLIEPVDVVSIYDDSDDAGLQAIPREQIEADLAIVRRAISGIEAMPIEDYAAVNVVQYISALPIALRDIERTLEDQCFDDYTTLFSSFRYLHESLEHFDRQHERFKYGWVVRLVRRFTHPIRKARRALFAFNTLLHQSCRGEVLERRFRGQSYRLTVGAWNF
jgi:hypothetical protein